MQRPLVIGTRGSKLALAQAGAVRNRLARRQGWTVAETTARCEIRVITTRGDVGAAAAPGEAGAKGLFVKDLEAELIRGQIDVAVHSAKDMPAPMPEGLCIAAVLPRADPHDVLISGTGPSLTALPQGARLGTSSPRRRAQCLALRPDLTVVPLRGNVDTRLDKVARGEVDAAILARAGLQRLGLERHITAVLPADDFLPAAGQGTIVVEARSDDSAVLALFSPLNHAPSALELRVERRFVEALDGTCHSAIGALARAGGRNHLSFCGRVWQPDGTARQGVERLLPLPPDWRESGYQDSLDRATEMAHEAAQELKAKAGPAFFPNTTQ